MSNPSAANFLHAVLPSRVSRNEGEEEEDESEEEEKEEDGEDAGDRQPYIDWTSHFSVVNAGGGLFLSCPSSTFCIYNIMDILSLVNNENTLRRRHQTAYSRNGSQL